jgi:hypothetical protein
MMTAKVKEEEEIIVTISISKRSGVSNMLTSERYSLSSGDVTSHLQKRQWHPMSFFTTRVRKKAFRDWNGSMGTFGFSTALDITCMLGILAGALLEQQKKFARTCIEANFWN